MGRHAMPLPPADGAGASPAVSRPGSPRTRRRTLRPLPLGLAVVVLVLALGLVGYLLRGLWTTDDAVAAGGGSADCEPGTEVTLVADPLVADAVRYGARDAVGDCVGAVNVLERTSAQALADMSDNEDATPDLWVPDSSLWATRATGAGLGVTSVGSLASSPVVVATSKAAVAQLEWQEQPPSWADVVASARPIANGSLAGDAAATLALLGLAESTDSVAERRSMLVASSLAAQFRDDVTTPQQGLEAIVGTDATAPIVITSKAAAKRAEPLLGDRIVVVEPRSAGPPPALDFPLLQLEREQTAAERAATGEVVAALSAAAVSARADMLGPVTTRDAYVAGTAKEVDRLDLELSALAVPSQLLVVVDVSSSMEAAIDSSEPGAGTRAEVAADALVSASERLPDSSRVGMWYFAADLGEDGEDWIEEEAVLRYDTLQQGTSHRESVIEAARAIPRSLRPGGTGLYDTIFAAMTDARELVTPDTATTVVLITDGQNEDSAGLSLEQLEEALLAEAADGGRVNLMAVAFGPDSDLDALRRIADAADGWGHAEARSARDSQELGAVLNDTLSARLDALDEPGGR